MVNEPMDVHKAEERLAHYHPEHHHFYEPAKSHRGKRLLRIVIAGTGFMADSYDLFVINIALLMMTQNKSYDVLTPDVQTQISMMAIVGALAGQLFFGVLGDEFGRKTTFVITAFMTIIGTILTACVQPTQVLGMNIWQQMMLCRFLMGMGVGGEYPMASTITAESSAPQDRGRNLAAVFSMQGVGRVLCALMLLIAAFTITNTHWQWRFAIIMGAVPMILAVYFRWTAEETEAYKHQVKEKKASNLDRARNIARHVWANRVKLAGTAGSWFILDVLFYGNSLFSADVTRAMGTENNLEAKTVQNLCIQLMAMPGYILAVIFLDRIGRKRLQLIGFAGEAIIFCLMAVLFRQFQGLPALFVFMYALTFFFDDFGANTTTFVIPAEIFPTDVRSTCHGISAAFGKAGAAIGASVFLKVANMFCPGGNCRNTTDPGPQEKGIRVVFIACAVLSVIGFLWTWALVQDKPHASLEEVENIYSVEEEVEGEVEALELVVKKGSSHAAEEATGLTAPPTVEDEAKVR
ncbi:inorganic phosphate [Nannochloropsis oceanica]